MVYVNTEAPQNLIKSEMRSTERLDNMSGIIVSTEIRTAHTS